MEVSAEVAELAERLDEAREAASRSLLHAVLVTLLGPGLILAQAPLFWSNGWPGAAGPLLGIATAAAVAMWCRWVPASREVRQHRRLFDHEFQMAGSGRRRVIRTDSLWSARGA